MAISKKLRFEVFKRDGFRCQYCGKTPPDAILEIDHINPKSQNGKDDINNLLTACFDCNRGKGNIPLKKIPSSFAINIEILKEKEDQLKYYNQLLNRIERRIQKDINEINEIFHSYFAEWDLSAEFKNNSVKRFLKHLPKQTVADSMHIACGKMHNSNAAIKYFCGICWNKINERNE